jgi:hypothetical protein
MSARLFSREQFSGLREQAQVSLAPPDAALLEGKAGPFDPQGPREFADWAPEEGTPEALVLLRKWRSMFQ